MNGLPYYPRYPRDFFDGTSRLSFEVKGAYAMLLDLIYMSGGKLYDEARFISGHMNCSVRAWNKYRSALIDCGKIKVENGIISNFRADKELIIQRSFQDKQRQNASQPKKNNNLPQATAKPKVSHTDTDTEYKKEIGKPISIGADGFEDFWNASPRKIAKASAQKAYAKALRLTDASTLLNAIRSYAEARQGQDQQYTAHPATWLNAGRWMDTPETHTKGTPNGKGDQRLAAALRGAAVTSPMDRGQGGNPSQPLLAIR